MKCANCGKKITNDEYRNVDGDPCCKECWVAEEEWLKHY